MVHRIYRDTLACTCGLKFSTEIKAIDHSQAMAKREAAEREREKL